MDKVKEIVVLKNLLNESVNGDEHGIKPDLTDSEMEALEWAIVQAEKVEKYEEVLKEVADAYAFADVYDEVTTKRFIAKQVLEKYKK